MPAVESLPEKGMREKTLKALTWLQGNTSWVQRAANWSVGLRPRWVKIRIIKGLGCQAGNLDFVWRNEKSMMILMKIKLWSGLCFRNTPRIAVWRKEGREEMRISKICVLKQHQILTTPFLPRELVSSSLPGPHCTFPSNAAAAHWHLRTIADRMIHAFHWGKNCNLFPLRQFWFGGMYWAKWEFPQKIHTSMC